MCDLDHKQRDYMIANLADKMDAIIGSLENEIDTVNEKIGEITGKSLPAT